MDYQPLIAAVLAGAAIPTGVAVHFAQKTRDLRAVADQTLRALSQRNASNKELRAQINALEPRANKWDAWSAKAAAGRAKGNASRKGKTRPVKA